MKLLYLDIWYQIQYLLYCHL